MLPAVLATALLALLQLSHGQGQVPVQANFDPTKVCPLLLTVLRGEPSPPVSPPKALILELQKDPPAPAPSQGTFWAPLSGTFHHHWGLQQGEQQLP